MFFLLSFFVYEVFVGRSVYIFFDFFEVELFFYGYSIEIVIVG